MGKKLGWKLFCVVVVLAIHGNIDVLLVHSIPFYLSVLTPAPLFHVRRSLPSTCTGDGRFGSAVPLASVNLHLSLACFHVGLRRSERHQKSYAAGTSSSFLD